MSHRREFLLVLLGMPVALARAQPVDPVRPMRVALIRTPDAKQARSNESIFVDTLRDLGWIEGRNIVFDRAYANGDETRLPALAAAAVARKPDVIYVQNNPELRAVLASTRAIPVVFSSVSLPVENGFVKSLRRPGGSVTGVASMGYELGGRRMQLLKRVLPHVKVVGVLHSPGHLSSRNERQLIEQAAGRNAQLTWLVANEVGDIDAALAAAAGRVEALLVTTIPIFIRERGRILTFAAGHRLPVIGPAALFAEEGALVSYSVMAGEQVRRAAYLADKILRGASPGAIPVEQPTKFELVVNLKVAKALGVAIPHAVLVQASRVIE